MIALFRKIRHRLLTQNRISKYLLYAVGEIVLVVIGILIALGVNNWNEHRKLQNSIDRSYIIISNDLLLDIEIIDEVLTSLAPLDSIYKKVLANEITQEGYKNCKKCSTILLGYPDISLNKRGRKLLEEMSPLVAGSKDQLTLDINRFYSYYSTEMDVALDEADYDFRDNYNYFKNNKAWFVDLIDGKTNSDFMEYALTSSDYRNRVRSFYLLYYTIYLDHLINYKADAQRLVTKINERAQ